MHYVQHFKINDIDTKQVACIELQGKPNTATEGAVGLLGVDVKSPTHEVYKCVAVNGSIYTWELMSGGMSILSATITGEGGEKKTFPYTALLTPDGYLVKKGDLILDSEGYLYKVIGVGLQACTATYCGTHIGGMVLGDKDYSLRVSNGKLQLVTESGNVISNIDYLVPDETTAVKTDTGEVKVVGIYSIGGAVIKLFYGTQAEYDALTDEQKVNLCPIITDDTRIEDIVNGKTKVGKASVAEGLTTPTARPSMDANDCVNHELSSGKVYVISVENATETTDYETMMLYVGTEANQFYWSSKSANGHYCRYYNKQIYVYNAAGVKYRTRSGSIRIREI